MRLNTQENERTATVVGSSYDVPSVRDPERLRTYVGYAFDDLISNMMKINLIGQDD